MKKNQIIGQVTADGFQPRILELNFSDTGIEGTFSAKNYATRHIRFELKGNKALGFITAGGYNTRQLILTAKDEVIEGTITAKDSSDRHVYLRVSRDDTEALKMVLFFLLLDMRMYRSFLSKYHSSLNLNTNLNLP
jgi:hypothetical protein